MNDPRVEALIREVHGYRRRGLKAREKAVLAELERLEVDLAGAGLVETTAAKPKKSATRSSSSSSKSKSASKSTTKKSKG
jgi:hypothetical protein